MGFAGFRRSPSSPSKEGSGEVLVPTSATPFEGLLLVGSRSPSLGSAPFLTVRSEATETVARQKNPRRRMGSLPACRGSTERVRRATAGHFLPSGTTRKRHSHDTCGAGLFVSSRELFRQTQGCPWPQATSTRTRSRSTRGSIRPQDLLTIRIGLRSRDLPALPGRGRSLDLGFRHTARRLRG
jgi:hypothetical protein